MAQKRHPGTGQFMKQPMDRGYSKPPVMSLRFPGDKQDNSAASRQSYREAPVSGRKSPGYPVTKTKGRALSKKQASQAYEPGEITDSESY